jgi:predicted permease
VRWLTRLANLVRRRDLNAEIDEELQFHLETRVEENRAAGMTEAEARRDAHRRFGSRPGVREAVRDVHIFNHVERLWQDLRHGIRVFARNPGLTFVAVASIAFGTGANVAIFSVADTLLLRPLPVPHPSEVVSVGSRVRNGPIYRHSASYLDYLDLRDRATSFAGLAAFEYEIASVTVKTGDVPHARFATFVSADFFEVLQVKLAMGRGFLPDESAERGTGGVVVLSDGLWKAYFDADPNVVGRTLTVGSQKCRVVGVAPPSFKGLDRYVRESVYLPITMLPRVTAAVPPDVLERRDARMLTVKGRLRPGISISQAQAELDAIALDLERLNPNTNRDQSIQIQTELEYKIERRPYDYLLVTALAALSIGVLCVACANVAGLLASRGPVRAREMALRLAIGANRPRLIRQLITESLSIAVAGAAGGLGVAWIGIRMLRQVKYPTEVFAHPPFEMNERALVFGLVVAAASALLVGLGPAFQTTRVDLVTSLKTSEPGAGSPHRRISGRFVLVALQVALSLVLLTLSVFTLQLFQREIATGPGFRTSNMTIANIMPSRATDTDARLLHFYDQLLDDAAALPGVQSASMTSAMPLFSFQFAMVLPEGPTGSQVVLRRDDAIPAWAASIDGRYFETIDIRLLKGRTFAKSDDATAPAVAIVNATLARRYWPESDPIGRRLVVFGRGGGSVEIVGVVAASTYGLPGELPQDAIYFPYPQRPRSEMVLLTHTAVESSTIVGPVRDLAQKLDPDVTVSDAQTMETFYAVRVTIIGTVLVRLVGGMGLMGLLLTMVGLYGLVSYAVSRRTREIGIRIAIGATYSRIVAMVLRQGLAPAWVGLVSGLVLSVATARLLENISPLSFGVRPSAFYVVVPLLVGVTLAASFVPARRAAKVNPVTALRTD